MSYDSNNIFARILRHEVPAKIIYEDDYALAFHDINPQAPLHVLVIPKGNYISFYDFSQNASFEETKGFYGAVKNVIDQLEIHDDGFRVLTNNGVNGGQEVPHFHLHIFAGRPLGRMIQSP
ncbi:HIT family protein [Candidatus Bealeia paramacronuclearis]|uniref:HIT family protein n=1 Tax=Candidatus Bealeia paramacronuclearis TaxID=1921001 RepID=A0ABZ2C5P7_9PROT